MYFRREVREVSSDIRADHGSQYRSELTVIHAKFAELVFDPIIVSLTVTGDCYQVLFLTTLQLGSFARFCLALPGTPWLAGSVQTSRQSESS